VSRFVVRKLGYSRLPWRIVEEATGRELWHRAVPFDHPDIGMTSIPAPVAFRLKREAVVALAELEDSASADADAPPALSGGG